MKTTSASTRIARNTRYKIEHAAAAVLRGLGMYSLVHTLYVRLFKKYRMQNLHDHGLDSHPTDLTQLTPEARGIYGKLQAEICIHRRGRS
jgi:hypothetical protein